MTVPFTGNFFIRPNYIDNYWIKDPTFFSDMNLRLNNAALGMELSSLHNWSFSPVNLYSNMDMGTLLSNFWNIAQQNANAQASSWMMGFPQLSGVTPGIAPWNTGKVDNVKTPGAKEDLTDEEKEEFEEYTKDFNKLYDRLNEVDSEVAKKLGLDKILKNIKEDFESANTPNKVMNCIKSLKEAIDKIDNTTLKKILINTMPDTVARDQSATKLYDENTDKTTIYGLMYPKAGDAVAITKDNIINELDTRMCNEHQTSPIEALTSREDADEKEIKKTVEAIVDVLLQRAAEKSVKDDPNVKAAAVKLAAARDGYMEKKGEKKYKEEINNAFVDLYKAIKVKEAKNMDEKNKTEIIDELPDILKEKYLDKDGKLKPEYRINENNVTNLMKTISGGTQAQVSSGAANYAATTGTYTPQKAALNGKEVEVDGITGAAPIVKKLVKNAPKDIKSLALVGRKYNTEPDEDLGFMDRVKRFFNRLMDINSDYRASMS